MRMRRRVHTARAAVVLLSLGCSQVVGAESLYPHQIRQNLFAACLINERVGWVAGELGRILRTEDGGTTWTRQEVGTKKPLLAMSCLNTENAWVAGKSGVMFRTNDGGVTWEQLASGTSKHIFDITFVSLTHGVAVGDWGLTMYSEDGGLRWTLVGVPDDLVMSALAKDIGLDPHDVILYALAFPDTSHGWTVGEFGTIMATVDGGRTWHQQKSPVDTTLFGTYFENTSRGWAVGIDAVILQTTDGGTTWRQVRAPLARRSFYDIAISGHSGWIAGDAGTLLKTVDSGRTWVVEPLPIELAVNWFRTVRLLPSGNGLATGGDGLLFRIEKDRVRDLRPKPSPAETHRGPS